LRLPDLDFATNFGTFSAVFLGALLATVGGVASGQLEAALRRREREQGAALLFGEVLSTLAVLLRFADETRGVGDPYGPITMRMLRAARREIEVYDRNRETLYELRDAELRVRIHTLVVRLTMPLDSLIDSEAEVRLARAEMRAPGVSEEAREEAREDLARLDERRRLGFDFVLETAAGIEGLIAGLAPIARHDFSTYDGPGAPSAADVAARGVGLRMRPR
jgi:hypothetical protein